MIYARERRFLKIFKEKINLNVTRHFTIDTDDVNEMALQVGTNFQDWFHLEGR